MAGLGEACSHVAAVLFAAEANSVTKLQFSSTSLPCSWLPSTFQSVKFSEINGIDFSTPQLKRKLLITGESGPKSMKKYAVLPPTEKQLRNHYSSIALTSGKPSLLSLVSGMNQSFIPKYVSGELSKPLTYLYDKKALSLSFSDLLQKCEDIYDSVAVSVAQAKLVEEATRKQSNSKIWCDQRSGHVTAHLCLLLNLFAILEQTSFFSKACEYGCQHEDEARSIYSEIMAQNHSFFPTRQSGLLLDP